MNATTTREFYGVLFTPDGAHVYDHLGGFPETIEEAWEIIGNMGSRWIFYPITFIFDHSGTCQSAPEYPDSLGHLEGCTVAQIRDYIESEQEYFEAWCNS